MRYAQVYKGSTVAMDQFDGIEREIGGEAALGVIWLHGLGADAGDFLPIIGELELPTATRFVFPNAPYRNVTVNGGMLMRAWFDILGFGPDAPEDTAGLAASVAAVQALVEREIARGLAPERIVLAGFSQGGAVVLHAGLGGAHRLGGIIGLSTFLPAPAALIANGEPAADIPVWLAHGTADPIIPLRFAELSASFLREHGVELAWSTYAMGHEVTRPEIADLSAWLRRFAVD
jgi:phospholipase/carboxylesterase